MILDSAIIRGEMMRQEIGVNELGRKAGIEPRAISRYSRFDSRVFAPTAGKLAKALGIEPEQLLKRNAPHDQ